MKEFVALLILYFRTSRLSKNSRHSIKLKEKCKFINRIRGSGFAKGFNDDADQSSEREFGTLHIELSIIN